MYLPLVELAVYFLTLVDDYSLVAWVYLLQSKTEVRHSFFSFLAMIQRQLNHHLARADGPLYFDPAQY